MKGVSTVIGSIIIILILISSLALVYIIINNQNNLQQDAINEINNAMNKPILNELLINGEPYIISTKSTILSYIIYPNNSIKKLDIPIQSRIPIKEILGNASWAILVTRDGYWINVTNIQQQGNQNDALRYSLGFSDLKYYAPIPESNIYSSVYYYVSNSKTYFDYIFQGKIYYPEMTPLGINNITLALPYYNTSIIISSLGLPRTQSTPSYYMDEPYMLLLIFPTGRLSINPNQLNVWYSNQQDFGYEKSMIMYYNNYYNVTYWPFLIEIRDNTNFGYGIPNNSCFHCLVIRFIVSAYFDGQERHSGYSIVAVFSKIYPYLPWKVNLYIFTNSTGNYLKVSAIQNGSFYNATLWAPINLKGYWEYGFVKTARLWPYDRFTNGFYFYLSIPAYYYINDFGIFSYPIYVESISNGYVKYSLKTN
ncbi:MAG: hypothetical protein QXV69_08480 [Sulfolobaceae archaeon]